MGASLGKPDQGFVTLLNDEREKLRVISPQATAARQVSVAAADDASVNSLAGSRREDLALHPTVKPTALVADALQDVTRRGQVVLDIFLGSGTTLIAAERTGRRFRGIELDPAYVDVALNRWSAMTGHEPHLAKYRSA
jgi:DNA modification methylase